MAEIVGAVASVLTLLKQFQRVSERLAACKDAPKQLEYLQKEIFNVSSFLVWFYSEAQDWQDSHSNFQPEHVSNILVVIKNITTQCNMTLDDIKKIQARFRGMLKHGQERPVEYLWCRFQWYLRKPPLELLLAYLQASKSSMTLFLCFLDYEKARTRLESTNSAEIEQRLNRRIENLEKTLRLCQRDLKKTRQSLKNINRNMDDRYSSQAKRVEEFIKMTQRVTISVNAMMPPEDHYYYSNRRRPAHQEVFANPPHFRPASSEGSSAQWTARSTGSPIPRHGVEAAQCSEGLSSVTGSGEASRQGMEKGRTIGSRIRDQGTGIMELHGEWPTDCESVGTRSSSSSLRSELSDVNNSCDSSRRNIRTEHALTIHGRNTSENEGTSSSVQQSARPREAPSRRGSRNARPCSTNSSDSDKERRIPPGIESADDERRRAGGSRPGWKLLPPFDENERRSTQTFEEEG